MKKNSTKGYVILGILFALISVIAFTIPTTKTATFWIAYAFTVVAFAVQIVIWKIALGKEETLKSKFLGFPIIHISIVYLILQIIAFAVFMFLPMLASWSAVVTCSIIVGVSAVCMIVTDAGSEEIKRVEVKVQKKVFYIRELQADIELVSAGEKDDEIKTALMQLAEKIRFSDPMSNEQLADLENMISVKATELKTAANKAEIITELNSLLDERNKKCKILK